MTSHNHVQKNFSLKNICSAFYAFAGTLARNCTFGGLRKEKLIISYNLSKEQLKKDWNNKLLSFIKGVQNVDHMNVFLTETWKS